MTTNPSSSPETTSSPSSQTSDLEQARELAYEADLRAQQAAEKRLSICWEVEEYADEDLPPELEAEAAAIAAPFCGCQTCEIREVLDAAYPHLKAGWEAELQLLAAGPQPVPEAS